jgi:metallo-beta-lactamase family protein
VKEVSIFGQRLAVRAKVHTLGGFSAHAGQTGLVNWARPFQQRKPRLFLTHGEDDPRKILHNRLKSELGLESEMLYYGNEVEL